MKKLNINLACNSEYKKRWSEMISAPDHLFSLLYVVMVNFGRLEAVDESVL